MIDTNGLLVVNKEAGLTSHDVVNRVRRLFNMKKVGHTGTLDPEVTGVLVLCLGYATRLAEYLTAERKHYRAVIRLGISTTTQDATGIEVSSSSAAHISEIDVRSILPLFTGAIEQVPPMVSAVHHEGKRLYELARAGIEVERTPRSVIIEKLQMNSFQEAIHPTAELEITCSSGVYIRTLASDIGEALGVGGHMVNLERTWVGRNEQNCFHINEAISLQQLYAMHTEGNLLEAVLSPLRALDGYPTVFVEPDLFEDLRQGRSLNTTGLMISNSPCWPPLPEQPVALVDKASNLLALAKFQEGYLFPFKVFMHS